MASVYSGQSNVIAYLLKHGVDLEALYAHGMSVLMLSVDVVDTNFTIVKMLINAGAKTNVEDDFGQAVFLMQLGQTLRRNASCRFFSQGPREDQTVFRTKDSGFSSDDQMSIRACWPLWLNHNDYVPFNSILYQFACLSIQRMVARYCQPLLLRAFDHQGFYQKYHLRPLCKRDRYN